MSIENEDGAFIVIQGIDGTGKSTTVDMLTQMLNERGLSCINYDRHVIENPLSPAKKSVLQDTTPTTQYAYFLASTLFHSEEIRRMNRHGTTVIKGRHILDVMAHHAHLGVSHVIEIAHLFDEIQQPDFIVLLTTEEGERMRRIDARGNKDAKDEPKTPGGRLDFFETFLMSQLQPLIIDGKAIQIDTTVLSPEDVAHTIVLALEQQNLIPTNQ